MTRITRGEWRRVTLFALLAAALTTLPYLLVWANQGDDWRFGGFLLGVEDGHSYLGKMRLGARGVWDFTIFYTPEQHDPAPLVFLPYLVPGQIVGRFFDSHDPALTPALILTFHALRVVFNGLLLVVMYRFIAIFLRRGRFFALVLATAGGGFGWLLVLLGQGDWLGSLPADFYIPEGFSFLILFGLPHLALARAALLGGLVLMLRADWNGQPRAGRPASLIAAGLCWNVMGLCVPFYLGVVYVILGAWGLAAWGARRRFPTRLFWGCAAGAGLTLPLFAYFALAFAQNPVFAQWSAQNQLPSPHPLHYVAAYGLLALPALAGVWRAWHRARRDIRFALLVGWPLIVPLLVYLPINVQRRMAEAVIVPLAILAVLGVRWLARRGVGATQRLAPPVYLLCASLTTVVLLFGATTAALSPRAPLFRPVAELRAFDWLNAQAAPGELVLASVATGNALPAYTDLRTYMGHGPETLHWPERTGLLERFFRAELTPVERADLLERASCRVPFTCLPVRYIVYGPNERALAPDAPAVWAHGLTLIYDWHGYRIYRVP